MDSVRWLIRIVLGVALIGSVVLLVLAFGDFRRELVIPAFAITVPVFVFLAVSVWRGWSWGSLPLLIAAGVMVVAVGSASGYRAWSWRTCAEEIGPKGDLHGCDLRDENLVAAKLGSADLSDANLTGMDLQKADLVRADLRGAKLAGAKLGGIIATRAKFAGADLRGAHLAGATLGGADLSRIKGARADFTGAKLGDASLAGADLSRANLSKAGLSSASLEGADLSGANGSEAELVDANLRRARLADLNLNDVDATNADFSLATLRNVKLNRTKLVGTRGLTDAKLADALGVDALEVARALSQKRLFLEPEGQIADALGPACRGKRVPGAGTSGSNGTFVVILHDQGGKEASWKPQPTALRFAEFVACLASPERTRVGSCGPYVYSGTNRRAPDIAKYQVRQRVRLVNPRTARVLAKRTIEGAPPNCPFFEFASTRRVESRMPYSATRRQIASMLPKR